MSEWTAAMRAGDYPSAWALSESSLRARDPATRDDPTLPYHLRWVWDGRPFDGRHALVRCYHGLGDTLQFARFLPLLARHTASLTLEVQPSLIPLLSVLEGIDRIVPFDPAHPLPPAQVDLEITELDLALHIPPGEPPSPYLHTTCATLPQGTLGLCYGSGDWDAQRSIPPDLLAPLCTRAPCITLVAAPTALPVLNPAGCPFDMEATAALVAGADLIITVDTMIAHLAGALGRSTWLLLKAEPDWRWNPALRTSAWYPTMRLYPQPRPGDWASVIAQVEHDLAARTLLAAER